MFRKQSRWLAFQLLGDRTRMQLKKLVARCALGAIMLSGILACQITDQLIAQAPTPTRTRTRTLRPTFTPIPPPTETFTPVPTALPTAAPLPTRTSTRRPLPTATKRPATAIPPPPPPQATQPPKPNYQYSAANYRCEHSGSSWLKGHVYSDKNDPNSAVPGIKVAFGGAGGDAYGTTKADDNGDFAFTLTADGQGAKIGTFYIWLTDDSGNRISDMAGPIQINGLGPDAPNTCWAGWAYFTKNF